MKYSEGCVGRVFVLGLEHDDRLPEALERFAAERKVERGLCIITKSTYCHKASFFKILHGHRHFSA
jgi:predicted DNA-binding protein with PD1-like motif